MEHEPRMRLLDPCEPSQVTEDADENRDSNPERDRPVVHTDVQEIDLLRSVWKLLQASNSPPVLFRRAGTLVQLNKDEETGALRIEPLTKQGLYRRLIEIAQWKNGAFHTRPPHSILSMLMHPDAGDLPELLAITGIPVLTKSFRIMDAPGYDSHEKYYFDDAYGLATVTSSAPNLDWARETLFDALHDFPFVSEADRTHAIAAMILPIVRPALKNACAPIHMLAAACPGSGKGLLADLISVVATGETCEPITLSSNPEENSKRLAGMLDTGKSVLHLDNWPEKKTLDDPALASLLTSTKPSFRRLGSNYIMTRETHTACILLSGNNPRMSTELTRRCIRIRIDPQTDRPWLRTGFRHEHLIAWAKKNRKELVQAVVNLIHAWLLQGSPRWQGTQLGSFEQWSSLMGGILTTGGFRGFLANMREMYEVADPEGREWRVLTQLWWETFANEPVKASHLHEICQHHDLLMDLVGMGGVRSQVSRLGHALNRNVDRVFGNYKICLDTSVTRSSARYILHKLGCEAK